MFIVFNKEKINSYIISLGTVAILFVMAFMITREETVETSATKQQNIYSVEVESNEVNEVQSLQNQTNE